VRLECCGVLFADVVLYNNHINIAAFGNDISGDGWDFSAVSAMDSFITLFDHRF
jgi:hypothetical protein